MPPGRLTVMALGKLGGRELGYHSDLDLIFLYPATEPGVVDAPGQTPAHILYARLTERFLSFLQMPLREGLLYKIDTRLRPSGNQGALMTSDQGEEGEGHANVTGSTTLTGAIRTIVVADAVMSLDNVLAVAGAAKGSMMLVVFGILVSIPIIVYGSQFVLRLMDRFPAVITLGAGLLGWIAGEMLVTDVTLEPYLAGLPHWFRYASAVAGALFVVVVGTWLARRTRVAPAPIREIPLASPGDRKS